MKKLIFDIKFMDTNKTLTKEYEVSDHIFNILNLPYEKNDDVKKLIPRLYESLESWLFESQDILLNGYLGPIGINPHEYLVSDIQQTPTTIKFELEVE